MTEQEAYDLIEIAAAQIEWDHSLEYQVAFDIAKNCIKKRIEEEPQMYKSHPEDLYLCSDCGSTFITNFFGTKMKFCPNCGKKQKWERSTQGSRERKNE